MTSHAALPRLLFATMLSLAAGCGGDDTIETARPGQESALAVVREVFAGVLDEASMSPVALSIQWSGHVCPYPAADGLLKTAVIDPRGTCYAGLAHGCDLQVAWRGSFAQSAFAHELMHCYMSQLDLTDPSHDRHPEMWRAVSDANRALREAGL